MAEGSDDENEIQALTREVEKAAKMRRALVKLKHRLETKLKIPCSATFKEFESFANVDQPKNNFACVDISSYRAKLELCLIAGGIKCVDVNSGKMRFELQFGVGPHIYSGYQIQIDEVEGGGFCLSKYNLPEGLNVKTIIQKVPMKDTSDLSIFLKFVRACSSALLHRRKQTEELKYYCANESLDIDVFTSSDITLLEIIFQSDVLKLSSETEKMSFILKYAIDAHLPTIATYEKEHINQEDKSLLDSYCSDFLTWNLVEALGFARHVKHQPRDSIPKQSKHSSRRTQKFSKDSVESMPESTSPKHMPTRTQQMPKEEVQSRTMRTSPRRKSIRVQALSDDDDESMPESSPPRRNSTRTQKVSEEVESRPINTSPKHVPTRLQKMPGEKVEPRTLGTSRSKSIRMRKFSDDESMPESTSPRRISPRPQKVPEQKIESRIVRTSPRCKSIRVQALSDDDDESMPESSPPRRNSTRTQKVSEEVESRPINTSPKHVPTRLQKMPGEKVEPRTLGTSRSKSIRMQKFSDDESMPESTSPRRISPRTQKVPEQKIESRIVRGSPRRTSNRMQIFSDDDDESMPESSPPRRNSTRTQKVSEEVESRPINASPKHVPTHLQKMPGEKVEPRTMGTSRSKSIRVQKFSDDDDDEYMPESTSPRRNSTRTQKLAEEKVEFRPKSASPRHALRQDKRLSGEDGVEFRPKSSSSKQVPIRTQQMPTTNVVIRIPRIPEHTPDQKIRKLQQRPFFSQKSSTPLRGGNTSSEQQSSDIDLDDLSTIMGSDSNVQSLSDENRNVHPVAESTPFVPPNPRQKRTMNTEKKLNSDSLQTNSSQINLHKYRQTQLLHFMKNQPLQTIQISESIKISPTNKLSSGQYSSESDENDDQKELKEMEKKRKSGINVHKGTPVPKGFQSSRMKKSVSRQSVVSGKYLRRKN
ncbi:hypothetical protein R5R35_001102 [Gryllus longicercus]|uniref:Uncharacterized protein n=1 Tax=Gryllus longicercus TaxID=2509291 RepID=A0AAN9VPS5_9ORTH